MIVAVYPIKNEQSTASTRRVPGNIQIVQHIIRPNRLIQREEYLKAMKWNEKPHIYLHEHMKLKLPNIPKEGLLVI